MMYQIGVLLFAKRFLNKTLLSFSEDLGKGLNQHADYDLYNFILPIKVMLSLSQNLCPLNLYIPELTLWQECWGLQQRPNQVGLTQCGIKGDCSGNKRRQCKKMTLKNYKKVALPKKKFWSGRLGGWGYSKMFFKKSLNNTFADILYSTYSTMNANLNKDHSSWVDFVLSADSSMWALGWINATKKGIRN